MNGTTLSISTIGTLTPQQLIASMLAENYLVTGFQITSQTQQQLFNQIQVNIVDANGVLRNYPVNIILDPKNVNTSLKTDLSKEEQFYLDGMNYLSYDINPGENIQFILYAKPNNPTRFLNMPDVENKKLHAEGEYIEAKYSADEESQDVPVTIPDQPPIKISKPLISDFGITGALTAAVFGIFAGNQVSIKPKQYLYVGAGMLLIGYVMGEILNEIEEKN